MRIGSAQGTTPTVAFSAAHLMGNGFPKRVRDTYKAIEKESEQSEQDNRSHEHLKLPGCC
jgi:hypothetical protein